MPSSVCKDSANPCTWAGWGREALAILSVKTVGVEQLVQKTIKWHKIVNNIWWGIPRSSNLIPSNLIPPDPNLLSSSVELSCQLGRHWLVMQSNSTRRFYPVPFLGLLVRQFPSFSGHKLDGGPLLTGRTQVLSKINKGKWQPSVILWITCVW
jgi:hypothetical protein